MFDPKLFANLVSQCYPLQQMNLMRPDHIGRFVKERGIEFRERHIKLLWQTGLLRADLIQSEEVLTQAGLVNIGGDDRQFIYRNLQKPHPEPITRSIQRDEHQHVTNLSNRLENPTFMIS